MAPAAAHAPAGEGWTERKVPELYKFEREGDEVIGFLNAYVVETAEGKKVPTYIIRDDSGDKIRVRATWDLLQKIDHKDVGCRIRIQFQGTQETERGKMMLFKVWIKPGPPRQNSPEITDADVPF